MCPSSMPVRAPSPTSACLSVTETPLVFSEHVGCFVWGFDEVSPVEPGDALLSVTTSMWSALGHGLLSRPTLSGNPEVFKASP